MFSWGCSVAGGQIYTDNKCRAMKNLGYDVYVIYPGDADIVLDNIRHSKTMRANWLSYMPSCFLTKQVECFKKCIIDFIDKSIDDYCFIESNDIRFSYWAELVAKELKCKHFIFTLEAYFNHIKEDNLDYLMFKHNRKELGGTRPSSLPQLLKGVVAENSEDNVYFRAICTNTLKNVSPPIEINWDDYEIRLGYLGRDSKPCFRYILEELDAFFLSTTKKVLLLCIGCNSDSKVFQEYLNRYQKYPNVKLIATGLLAPIPKDYVMNLDIALGSSGSAKVCEDAGTTTIRYLDNEPLPIGVCGYHFQRGHSIKRVYQGNLSDLIHSILNGELLVSNTNLEIDNRCYDESLIDSLLTKDAQFMMSSSTNLDYYNTLSIKYRGLKGCFIAMILGIRITRNLLKICCKRDSHVINRNLTSLFDVDEEWIKSNKV